MHIKRFVAQTVRDAVKAAKAEFGDEALVLSTKRLRNSPYAPYEVIAAVDYDLSRPVDVKIDVSEERAGRGDEGAGGKGGEGAVQKELNEVRDLKKLLWLMLEKDGSPLSSLFSGIEDELVGNGIDRRLAKKIILKTAESLSKDRLEEAYFRSMMKDLIYEKLDVADPLKETGVTAFVGASGAGKTTTVAKLASECVLKRKKRVALITMDALRPAAAEELRHYGRALKVPVEAALTPREVGGHLKAHADKDLILIDTAGRSPRRADEMAEMRLLSSLDRRIRFNLVLSARSRDESIYENVKAYGALPLSSLTFTKLDEGDVYGPILNAMILSKRPVAYLTSGRGVTGGFEYATKDGLLKYIIPNQEPLNG